MSTPHNSANLGDIAKLVLMPGDPLRAKHIADTYLSEVKQFNNVRGMGGYTGLYKGHEISVMGSGMGMPSMGIYSYELYKFYDVESIVRIGSCGALQKEIALYDMILTSKAFTKSSYGQVQNGYSEPWRDPSVELNSRIEKIANNLGFPLLQGPVVSSDVFYSDIAAEHMKDYNAHGILAVEMEAFALFHNAAIFNKQAATLLTVSDNVITQEETTAEERQVAFTHMMSVALGLAIPE